MDLAEVEQALQLLETAEPPLALRLPRAPGAREIRVAHLLSGPVALDAAPAPAPAVPGRVAQLEAEVAELKAALAALRAEFEAFKAQFG